MIYLKIYEHIIYMKGHKDSKGNSAPWVIKQENTEKILSSHSSKEDAETHLSQIEMHKHMNENIGIKQQDLDDAWKYLEQISFKVPKEIFDDAVKNGTIKELPLNILDFQGDNGRRLKASSRLDNPIIVIHGAKDRYLIADGNHRFLQYKNMGKKTIKAFVLEIPQLYKGKRNWFLLENTNSIQCPECKSNNYIATKSIGINTYTCKDCDYSFTGLWKDNPFQVIQLGESLKEKINGTKGVNYTVLKNTLNGISRLGHPAFSELEAKFNINDEGKNLSYTVMIYESYNFANVQFDLSNHILSPKITPLQSFKSVATIFETVIRIVIDFLPTIKENPVFKGLVFSSDNREVSRIRFYTSLLKQFANELHSTMKIEKNGTDTYFYIDF